MAPKRKPVAKKTTVAAKPPLSKLAKKTVLERSPLGGDDDVPMATAYVDPGPTQQLSIIKVLEEIDDKSDD